MLEHSFFLPLAQMNAVGPTSTTSATAPGSAPASGPAATRVPAATGTATLTAPAPMPETMPAANLPAPTDLTVTAAGTTQINLSWKDVSTGETGYHVYRSTDGKTFEMVKELPKDATSYSDTGLSAGTGYAYKVVPYNAAGEGYPAEKQGGTSASFFSSYGQIIIIVVMFAALYLFLFRGQRKEEKKRKAMIKELKKGDKVMTIGGMIARVVSIDGEEVVLKVDESANVKETYRKSAIQEVIDRDEKK